MPQMWYVAPHLSTVHTRDFKPGNVRKIRKPQNHPQADEESLIMPHLALRLGLRRLRHVLRHRLLQSAEVRINARQVVSLHGVKGGSDFWGMLRLS